MNNSSDRLLDLNFRNETQHEYTPPGFIFFSEPFTVFMTIALIIVIVVAIIGNTLVCIATCLNPNLRKATTSLFIVSLAVSDLLTATLSIPFDVYTLKTNGLWFHGEATCILWTTAYLLAVPTSNLTLLVLSIDRYLTLRAPLRQFRAGQFMTRERVLIYIAALWGYSLLFAILPVTGWEIWRLLPKYVVGEICYFNGSRLYNIMVSVLHFILPALAMCVIYFMIYKQIRRHTCTVYPIDSTVATQNGQAKFLLQRNIRAAKRIALIVSAFLTCWVPYSVLSIIANLCFECYGKIPFQVYCVTLLMGYSNSALNPFLYSFNNRNFIDSYKRLYRVVRKAFRRQSSGVK